MRGWLQGKKKTGKMGASCPKGHNFRLYGRWPYIVAAQTFSLFGRCFGSRQCFSVRVVGNDLFDRSYIFFSPYWLEFVGEQALSGMSLGGPGELRER